MATIKTPLTAKAAGGGGAFGRILRTLMWLLIVLVAIAAGGYGTWFFRRGKPEPMQNTLQMSLGKSPKPAPARGAAPGQLPGQFSGQFSGQPPGAPAPAGFAPAQAAAPPPPPPPAAPAALPTPIYVALDPVTVTVEDKDNNERLLHVAITLRVNDENTRARIEKFKPEVRSRLIGVLSSQTPQSVRSPEGRVAIAKGLIQELGKPFSQMYDGQYISDVLFTDFVVQ
jgi:flagellar FliL protein